MLQKHVQTVKEQIKFFDYKLNKNPKDSKTQATCWTLKYKFEKLLQYLKQQNYSQKGSNPKLPETLLHVSNSQKRNRMSAEKIQEFENKIVEFVKQYPNGVHVKLIYEMLMEYYPNIKYSKIANRVSELYAKKGRLEWVNKGIYKAKE